VCLIGFLGSTVVDAALTALLVVLEVPGGLGTVVLIGLVFPVGLLVWADLWRQPWDVVAALGLSLVGLVFGFWMGLILLWTAFPEHRPNLTL